MKKQTAILLGLMTAIAAANAASAVTIDTVFVGNPGNAPDTRYATPGFGSVGYTYQIGKFEVTAGQYCEFLNAVARTDVYELYHPFMYSDSSGCKIQQQGNSGSYTYSVDADRANRPVNYVSWGDVARFANWLHNGQPTTGVQDLSTTEDGSYLLNGATSREGMMTVIRKTGATWVIPNEDEWYKAAYYDPNKDGTGVAGYWDFPTKSDGWTRPNNDVTEPDGRNSANFRTSENFDDDYTLGAPYFTTLIGEFENSGSAYGTFDQGGNVAEWNETEIDVGLSRGLRGGSWGGTVDGLLASNRILLAVPSTASTGLGFRVANVPEPAGVTLLLGIAAVMLWRWQRNRISP